MQGMHAAFRSTATTYPACVNRSACSHRRFTTCPYKTAKRGVVVQAVKKDPEELVKRIGRGDIHAASEDLVRVASENHLPSVPLAAHSAYKAGELYSITV